MDLVLSEPLGELTQVRDQGLQFDYVWFAVESDFMTRCQNRQIDSKVAHYDVSI